MTFAPYPYQQHMIALLRSGDELRFSDWRSEPIKPGRIEVMSFDELQLQPDADALDRQGRYWDALTARVGANFPRVTRPVGGLLDSASERVLHDVIPDVTATYPDDEVYQYTADAGGRWIRYDDHAIRAGL